MSGLIKSVTKRAMAVLAACVVTLLGTEKWTAKLFMLQIVFY